MSRSRLKSAADALAALAGISLVLSALVQQVVFSFWGLDFTTIASLEDVTLGGLRVLTYALELGCPMLGSYIVFTWLADRRFAPERGSAARWIRYGTVGAILAAGIVSVAIVARAGVPRGMPPFQYLGTVMAFARLLLPMSVAVVLSLFVGYLTSPLSATELREGFRLNDFLDPVSAAALGLFVLILALLLYVSSSATLGLRKLPLLPTKCSSHGHLTGEVLWLGTRAVILRCRSSKFVIFPGEHSYSFSLPSPADDSR